MDGNRDESERCIKLAEKLINEGQRAKALKYLEKAEKLYPSEKAKDLIESLQKLNGATNYDIPESPQEGTSPIPPRRRSKSEKRHSFEEQKPEYTEEQLADVKRIKQCKDYYEILGVNKEFTESELKKQYRRLALQFHPDKNKTPGAAEAFKAIGNAFAVLSDPEKRRRYDLYGTEEMQRQSQQSAYSDYSRGFEGDVSPEELFNMFFGGGYPGGSVYVRRGNTWQRYRQPTAPVHQESGYGVILQMLPVIILICLSLMSSFFVSDPPYSLVRTSKYFYPRSTRNLDISYYVKENFLSEYQGMLLRIEDQVEEEYVSNLRTSCFRERNYKESMIWKAKGFRDKDLEEKARNLRTPSCDQLSELYRAERGL